MNLRPYQERAVEAAIRVVREGGDPLIVMPTGTGKTQVFAEIVRREASHGPIVVLAHRRELIDQAARRISSMCGREVAVEMADQRADIAHAWCIVASVQSMISRLDNYPPGSVSLLIIDEAHHAASESYRKIARHLGCPVIGVTATPERDDEEALAFTEVAFEYRVLDAMDDGWLVPLRAVSADIVIDASKLRTRGGDYTEESAAASIAGELGAWCRAVADLRGDRPTVLFSAGVAAAHQSAELLRGIGLRAASADGTTPTILREQILRNYTEGRLDVIANCGLWTEGWDAPHTACVAIGRVTKNRLLYMQMLGRGLRPSSGKADCLAIDVASSGSGMGLATSASVLGASWDDEVIQRAEEIAEDGDTDVGSALKEASDEIEEERRVLAAAKVSTVRKIDVWSTRSNSRLVEPRELGIRLPPPNAQPPSDKQAAVIARNGFAVPASSAEASAIIGWLIPRFSKGLCSAKQARLLTRYGLPIDVAREDATRLITAIAKNGWRRPRGVAA
jgi:superfamily II DNA or RNA helicase